MANPDGNPNPNIAEIGKATHFGAKRPDTAQCASDGGIATKNKHSLREALRRLSRFIPEGDNPGKDILAEAFGAGKKYKDLTMGERLMVRKFTQAWGDEKAMDTLIDHVDGKQIEKKVSASVSLASILNGDADNDQIDE